MERKKRRMVNNLTMSPRPVTEPTMVELKPLKITAEEGADKIKPKNTGRTINLDCQSHKKKGRSRTSLLLDRELQ